jgi:hypothetical protein
LIQGSIALISAEVDATRQEAVEFAFNALPSRGND